MQTYNKYNDFFKKELNRLSLNQIGQIKEKLILDRFPSMITRLIKLKNKGLLVSYTKIKVKRNSAKTILTSLCFLIKQKITVYKKNTKKRYLKKINIFNTANKQLLVSLKKSNINMSKGYLWLQQTLIYIYLYITLNFLIKVAFININRKNRNTFINISDNKGHLLKKISTGSVVARDAQKGRKKKLTHTAKTAVHNISFNFMRENKQNMSYNRYVITYKKTQKFFNYRSIISNLLKQKVFKVQQISRFANKTYGHGCKLKSVKRKRTKRLKSRFAV